jgi:hypothetical protein
LLPNQGSAPFSAQHVPILESIYPKVGKMQDQNKGEWPCLLVKIEILTKNGPYRFIYCLFLAIDANFRLKRKSVSSDAADPSLIDGKAYLVQENLFKDFLSRYGSKVVQEVGSLFSVNA